MNLCPTCRKMLYRTDACKGIGVECGRTDGGSKKSTVSTEGSARSIKPGNGTEKAIEQVAGRRDEPVLKPGTVDTSKRGPGRPRTITDMKAYRLEKQRERRARLREQPGAV